MSIKISVDQIEYSNTDNGAVIHIFGRDVNGILKKVDVHGFRPYFYAPALQADTLETIGGATVDIDHMYYTIKGSPLRRIYTKNPMHVRDIRSRYQHFEADIPFTTRYMIDTNIKSGIVSESESCHYLDIVPFDVTYPSRVCIADIECEDHRGFPEPERDAIICITGWDSFTNKYTTFVCTDKPSYDIGDNHRIETCRSEQELLTSFVDYIRKTDPDIMSGWNFTDFDLPYIVKRMNHLMMDSSKLARLPGKISDRFDIRGRHIFDLLLAYKKINVAKGQKESYRLDAIAEDELGERKVRYAGTLTDLLKIDPDKLIEYNWKDVDLCVRINAKNRIIDFYKELSRYVGCPLDKTINSSSVVDIYVLRKVNGKFVLPSKGNLQLDPFEGATVFDPSTGLKRNVAVFDLRALYPMSMMTLNASPETKDDKGELHSPNGVHFIKQPDGLTRSIIAELMRERDEKKSLMRKYPAHSPEYELYDMQQNVLKVIMNTYYGVSGYPRFRLYDHDIGGAVTSTGRAIIEYTRKIIETMGFNVIYGDTDSSMVVIKGETTDEILSSARAIEKELNSKYPEFAKKELNADVSYFSTKFEKLYKTFYQAGRKKRYAGNLIWKDGEIRDDIDIVGFEFKRSDSPKLTREVQKQLITMLLRDAPFNVVKDYLSTIITDYRRGRYSLDDIGIPGGIGKSLDNYEVDDAHVRGCKYANQYLGSRFLRGSKPKRIYIKNVTGKYPQTDVICFEYGDQVPPEFKLNCELMMEKTLKLPISRIIEPLGWTWQDFDPTFTTLSLFGID